MELPILNIFLILLLCITTNAIPTQIDDKWFSDMCSKTILPRKCKIYFKMMTKEKPFSSVEEVGEVILNRALYAAEESMNLFNLFVKKDNIAKTFYLKAKYEICCEKYKMAMDKLNEAEAMLKTKKFAEARDDLEDVSKVPNYCENLIRSTSRAIQDAYKESNFKFDVALAIMRELERHTRK